MGLFNRFNRDNNSKIKSPSSTKSEQTLQPSSVANDKTVPIEETTNAQQSPLAPNQAIKQSNTEQTSAKEIAPLNQDNEINQQTDQNILPHKKGLFSRLKAGLSKTRTKLGGGLGDLLLGKKIIDDELIDDIEMQLLTADIGVEAATEVMEEVRSKVSRNELQTMDALNDLLKDKLKDIITPSGQPLVINEQHKPFVILMVGINGAGKTTTIGKLAKRFQSEGKSVMLAAGDTFRAAAVEQLQVWGQRNNIPVIAQHTGADSASVIFDSVKAAQSRNIDIVIADTAGRLHNKSNLMDELQKVARVIKKLDPSAPHEVMLILDSGTGQNAIIQAQEFNKAIPITGISLTKMDGTAKGGVIFAIAKQLDLPIRFIGIGEQIDDLRVFDANDFINAIFSNEQEG